MSQRPRIVFIDRVETEEEQRERKRAEKEIERKRRVAESVRRCYLRRKLERMGLPIPPELQKRGRGGPQKYRTVEERRLARNADVRRYRHKQAAMAKKYALLAQKLSEAGISV